LNAGNLRSCGKGVDPCSAIAHAGASRERPARGILRPARCRRYPEPMPGKDTRLGVARQAWPIILANAAVPALGLVDTAVIGHYGTAVELGALALGALLFNFVYWSFGFLRMGTSGFVAQARGAGGEAEV